MSLMHPALWQLHRLYWRGLMRKWRRGLSSPRKAIATMAGIGLFVLWLGPSLAGALISDLRFDGGPYVLAYVPPLMVLICAVTGLFGGADHAVAFTPAEVTFLFPGPFRRREVILFRLMRGWWPALLNGLVFSVVLFRYVPRWLPLFFAVFLGFIFIQLFITAVVQVRLLLGKFAFRRTRNIVGTLLSVLLAVAVFRAMPRGSYLDWAAWANDLVNSDAVRILSMPFRPFALLATADALFPGALMWFGVVVLLDAGLLALVLRLEADYAETAMAASQRLLSKSERLNRGVFVAKGANARAGRPFAMLPRLGGVGPVLWRQLNTARRTAGRVLFLSYLAPVLFAALYIIFVRVREPHSFAPGFVIMVAAYASMMMGGMMRFDFRGDLDYMDSLKALPLPPSAVALGQVGSSALILTLFHWSMLLLAFALGSAAGLVFAGILFAPLACTLGFAIVNFLFLLYPVRMVMSPGDFQFMGKLMLGLLVRIVALAACFGIAAAPGALLHALLGIPALSLAVSWVVLVIETAAAIAAVAWAFERFDPSVDTPA